MDKRGKEDAIQRAEKRIVFKYNRVVFISGLILAIIVPPLIYKWKRESMAKLEDGAKKDIERVYAQGRSISEIPKVRK